MGVYSYPDGKGGQVELNFDMGSKKVLGPNGEELTTFQRYPNGQFGIVVPKSPENPNGGTIYLDPVTGVATSAETGAIIQGSYVFGQNELGMAFGGSTGDNTTPVGGSNIPASTGGTAPTGDTGGTKNTPTAAQITWQPNNAYETMAFDWGKYTCNWSLLNNNKVIDNTTGKQIGTWDRQYGLNVTMPDGKSHSIDWKANGNKIDVIHDNLGDITPSVTDLSKIKGYVLDKDGKKYLTFNNDGSIKNQEGKPAGSYTTNDDGRLSIKLPDGTSYGTYDPDAGMYYPEGLKPPPVEKPNPVNNDVGLLGGVVGGGGNKDTDLIGTVTSYGSDGDKNPFSLTSGGAILDEKGNPVGTYSSPASGEFDLKTPGNKTFGHYNANTGVLTGLDGTTYNAGFTPGPAIGFMPHAPASKGELTPTPEYKPGLLTPTPEYKPGLLTPTPEYKPPTTDFKGYTPPEAANPTPWEPNYELLTGRKATQ